MKTRLYILLGIFGICGCRVANGQSTSQNYIRTRTMLNESGSQYLDDIQYYDGLGRPFQLVKKGITPNRTNLAVLQEYDAYGRESVTWLPCAVNSDYVAPSTLKTQVPAMYAGDSRPYNQSDYEPSPLKRILKQYGPGISWSDKPVSTDYLTNTPTGNLRCTSYSVNSSGALTGNASYAPGELYVTKMTDEDGHIVYTFTDKLEQDILIRQLSGNEELDTYYVYDDFGNLCYVLPPMYQTNANLDLYAFQYKYDGRNRCIEKKLPGCLPVKCVYDKADNLVFSQDGVQRGKSPQEWTFYLYDAFHRPTLQGVCTNTNTASASGTIVTCSFSPTGGLGGSGYTSGFSLTSPTVYSANYYDTYEFRSLAGFSGNNNFPAGTVNSTGLLTGSITSLFGNATKIYSAIYYNIKMLPLKYVTSNHLGGYDITTTSYTFTGKPLTVQHVHSATGKATQTELYTYSYDHAERISQVTYKLNSLTPVVLSSNSYDTLGRLETKKVHGATGHNTTYAYNIRNWTTGITSTNFTESLYYNTSGIAGNLYYNGNISCITWKVGTETGQGEYRFNYDGVNRLTEGAYGGKSVSSMDSNYFTEKVTQYDKNGNIKHLQRYGKTDASSYGLVDDLAIEHTGNQLKYVNDAITAPAYGTGTNFINGSNTTGTEYVYDANGNLTQDLNKKISNIQYNMLNLPLSVQFSTGAKINYVYGTDGVKRRTTHQSGSTTTTIDYCGNVIYENGVLSKILTEEGYITLNGSTPTYHYYLKDHLGNNRVVMNNSGTVEQVNHYYPFGGSFGTGTDTSNQPFKFGGKELDKANGLNWYDFGARGYDPELGRFTTGDPMAEKYYEVSTYAYCMNNPINYIDSDGKKVIFINGYLGFGSSDGGREYWSNSFINGSISFFNDNNIPYFTNVEHNALSSASNRHKNGYKYARENYISLIKGMDVGDTFKLVSHSMGGAFSVGIKDYLEEQGWKVDYSVFINTYQSGSIKTKKDDPTFTIDYQNTNDPVLFWFDPNLGKGEIKNADIKIRVKSDLDIEYIHKGPIGSGETFWNELREIINKKLNR